MNFETGSFFFILGLCVLANLLSLGASIVLIFAKQKYRGWERPWILTIRCLVSVTVAVLVFQGFRSGLYGAFWAMMLWAVLEMPQVAYVILNDRKYVLARGEEWKWL